MCRYEELMDAIRTRRSIRQFKRKQVSDETIRKIVEMINWSPTSCHRQTAKVFVCSDPDRARQCIELCAGSSGFGEHIPLFFCFCSDLNAYQMPVELSLPYIDVSLGIQNCNLIAHTLGISLTMLSWAQSTEKEERRMRELLSIPAEYAIVVNAVGGILLAAWMCRRENHYLRPWRSSKISTPVKGEGKPATYESWNSNVSQQL